jgi:hypothetical protein
MSDLYQTHAEHHRAAYKTRWAWCIYGDPRPLLVTRWRWYARWCTIFDAMTYVCPWQR